MKRGLMGQRMAMVTTRRVAAAVLCVLAAGCLSLPAKLAAADGRHAQTSATGAAAPGSAPQLRATPGSSPAPDALRADGDIVIAPPPDVFDAPAAPAAPPPALLTAPPAPAVVNDGVWAVVIGIDDYPGSSADLQSAVADADDMEAALNRYDVPAENQLVLRDRQASASTILRAVDWLTFVAGPDATVVFFYAGHVRKLGPTTEAIVAADGGVITDEELASHLSPLKARDAWLIMAACFGGGFTEPLAPGRVLTAAADADSLAYENEAFGRSYLAEFMVRQGLVEGRSGATAQDAFAYAQSSLSEQYPDRMLTQVDQSLHPVAIDGRPHDTVSSPPTSAPPPPPPAPPTTQPPDGGSGESPPPEPPEECENLLHLFCGDG